jgi:hypothetical protein
LTCLFCCRCSCLLRHCWLVLLLLLLLLRHCWLVLLLLLLLLLLLRRGAPAALLASLRWPLAVLICHGVRAGHLALVPRSAGRARPRGRLVPSCLRASSFPCS